ncbi:glycoside hydrolase family 31 protein [Bacillaceae bacterium Marseille-Q3522]|nr:glycoside hydrolase family 31 protein [Bacillaceae bacterium Marseille-Q3522]
MNQYIALLHIYVLQLNGNYKEAEELLLQMQPQVDKTAFYNIATWLWLLQKQIALQPNGSKKLTTIDYHSYIDFLCTEWAKNHSSIWGDERTDVYLSNLSMTYAALQETKNTRNHFSVQKTMTEIRDYVFDHLLAGGSVLNGANERGYAADELLAVIPYGLFSPEDLIVVDAVQKMAVQLDNGSGIFPFAGAPSFSPAATAMFALYYLEKSDREKALYYAERARNYCEKDQLAKILLAIYDYYAADHLQETQRIIHDPLGNENVYLPQLTERMPHFPTLEDYLQLTCQVVAKEQPESVMLVMEDAAKTWKLEAELTPFVKNGVPLFAKKLKPLPAHGHYHYYFIAILKDGEKLVSQSYEVSTLEVHKAGSFQLLRQTAGKLLLTFGDEGKTYGLALSFREKGLDISLQQEVDVRTKDISEEKNAVIQSGEYTLKAGLAKAGLTLYKGEEIILTTHPLYPPIEWKQDINQQVTEFVIHWFSPASEQFYGFGERYHAVEQRGRVIDCFVYNQYRDQGTKTYMPIPFYLTNRGYGCHVATNTYTKFDLGKELKDKCTVTIEQVTQVTETTLHFYFGNYKEQIRAYTKDTGRPKMIPAWALGPWMSSNNWDREAIMRQEVEATKKHQIPATVLVLEQWSDETTYYMFNDAEYKRKHPSEGYRYEEMTFPAWGRWPDPKGMIDYLHKNNLKLLLWQIPIEKYLNKQQHPLKDQDEQYMIEKGFAVKKEDGTPYRIPENWYTGSLLVDFSNEEARKWWFAKRQYLIDIGVDGFKTDGGEFVFGKKLTFANGKTGSEMRNKYPNDYISAYHAFAEQNNGITFSRAGYSGAQNFPAHWAGDERSTFAAFKRSLIAGINAGLAGIPFWGWDLAGFNGDIPTAELYMRSAAMAAFCPIMQYHAESKAEFNQDRTPWNIAARTGQDQVIDVYRFYANVRMNLLPYLYHEAQKACREGLAMMRALMVDFPEDERTYGIYDEYLFGESLLVAPVIEEGSVARNVYLPEGTWFDFWNHKKIKGPIMLHVTAQVNEIPVFVKANQAILLNLDDSKQLGSPVGNDITNYKTPLCKLFCDRSFEQTVTDHLGNKVFISVQEETDAFIIKVENNIEGLQVEAIGNKTIIFSHPR